MLHRVNNNVIFIRYAEFNKDFLLYLQAKKLVIGKNKLIDL